MKFLLYFEKLADFSKQTLSLLFKELGTLLSKADSIEINRNALLKKINSFNTF
jgi:hypothetical protein